MEHISADTVPQHPPVTSLKRYEEDGGYRLAQWDSENTRYRESASVFRSRGEARLALDGGRVRWGAWE